MHAGQKMFNDIVNKAANNTPIEELERMNAENGTTFEINNGEITAVNTREVEREAEDLEDERV